MDLHKVKEIYQEEKEKILRSLMPQEKPLAFILADNQHLEKVN